MHAARSVQELFNVPFSRKRKQYMAELAGGMADAQPSKKPRKDAKGTEPPALETFPPAHYRMTAQQISERQFPACMRHEPGADSTGFVRTQPSGAVIWTRQHLNKQCAASHSHSIQPE